MQTYLKTRPVWIQFFLFIGLAFGIYFIMASIGYSIVSRITGVGITEISQASKWPDSDPNKALVLRWGYAFQTLGLFLIPCMLFAYFSDPDPKRYLGLRSPWKPGFWVLSIFCLLLAIPVVEFTGFLNKQIHFGNAHTWVMEQEAEATRQLGFMLGMDSPEQLFINLLFIAAGAAIGEELLFRGIFQRMLIRVTRNHWVGILLAAFVFSFFHMQFMGFLPRFFLGALLGIIYWYSGSLWTSILAHFFYNGFFIVLASFQPELVADENASVIDRSYLAVLTIISLALITGMIWWMKKNSFSHFNEVYSGDGKSFHQNDRV
jgi:membrane protease YdiL (CAAX protease family)